MKSEVVRFTELFNNGIIIPPYQRNYTWSENNCRQLCDDLFKLIRSKESGMPTHFFGTVIYTADTDGSYSIIDGQQRIVSVSLLSLAVLDCIDRGILEANSTTRSALSKYLRKTNGAVRIHLGLSDKQDYERLLNGDKPVTHSKVGVNYSFFSNYLERFKDRYSADLVCEAIECLEIVKISADPAVDNPQEIFDSINSKMEELTDADRIRNYLLMFRKPAEQELAYSKYWTRVEENTRSDLIQFLSLFVAVKCNYLPGERTLYKTFKNEFEERIRSESACYFDFLSELVAYSELYRKLQESSPIGDKKSDDILYTLKYLKLTYTYPFILRILKDYLDKLFSISQLRDILALLQSYVIRNEVYFLESYVRGKLDNSLCHLYQNILRFSDTIPFIERMKYVLSQKSERTAFINDKQLAESLSRLKLYNHRAYCVALFSILEDSNSAESVIRRYKGQILSIDHIMPQSLTEGWKKDLGPDYSDIHSTLVDNIGNLTLTAYNSNLGQKPFAEKRDNPEYGYIASGLLVSSDLGNYSNWGRDEILLHQRRLVHRLVTLLPPLESVQCLDPVNKPSTETLSLTEDYQGKQLRGYIFDGFKTDGFAKSLEVFVSVMTDLNRLFPSGVRDLKIGTGNNELIKPSNSSLSRRFKPIGNDLVVNTNFVVVQFVSHLVNVFDALDIDLSRLELITEPTSV